MRRSTNPRFRDMETFETPISRRFYSWFYLVGPLAAGLALIGGLGLGAQSPGLLLPYVLLGVAVALAVLGFVGVWPTGNATEDLDRGGELHGGVSGQGH